MSKTADRHRGRPRSPTPDLILTDDDSLRDPDFDLDTELHQLAVRQRRNPEDFESEDDFADSDYSLVIPPTPGANARKPRQCTSNWRTQKPCPVPGCGQLKSKPREHMRSCHPQLTPADIDELMKTLPPAGRRRKTGSKATTR